MTSFKETENAAANDFSSGHLDDVRESNGLHRQSHRHKNTYATWHVISQRCLVIMVQRPEVE